MDSFSKMIEDIKENINHMVNNPEELPWYMNVEQLKMTVIILKEKYFKYFADSNF